MCLPRSGNTLPAAEPRAYGFLRFFFIFKVPGASAHASASLRIAYSNLSAVLNARLPVFWLTRVMCDREDDDAFRIGAVDDRKWEALDEYASCTL